MFNIFISNRIKEKSTDKILFEIEGLKTSADNETYSPALELENLQRNGLSNVRTSSDEQDGEQNGSGYEKTKFRAKWKSARPNFCLDDNDIPKKRSKKSKSPYSPTKIKARHFLSNISYRRISDKDFQNANFIIAI